MQGEILHDYLKTHFEEAISQLEEFGKSREAEALHQFRVNSKKIRSVFKFMRTIEHGKKIKHINRSLRAIFWKAGELRDLQVRLSWLKRLRKYRLIEFLSLDKDVQIKEANLLKNIPDYADELSKLAKELDDLLPEVEDRQIVRYLRKIFFTIKSAVLANAVPDEWHEMRKKAKQLLYGIHWLDEKTGVRLERSALIKRVDELQDEIGQWHDEELFKDWLGQKQAYLSDDKNLMIQFEKVWNKLTVSVETRSKNIKKEMSIVRRLNLPTMGTPSKQ